ncbi:MULTISPECIES: prevent-host-death protein [unclassified Curtobacterium]|uniref:prevent-host-death protein n=1 Tax=unclassified Curtobacterium TaxID=257496 RepID=UPI001053B0D7|nr:MULTISPECIES: prevent-host-death protein [unclassified Curtobacterium]
MPYSPEALVPIAADYPTYSRAREHFKDMLDATATGRTVTVARDGAVSAMLPVDRLRDYFFRTVSPRVSVFREAGAVIALMEGRPFVAQGTDVDDALDDLALSLREYAVDWEDRLQHAPNHHDAWALVQLVKLSTDAELRDWLERGGE